jgi:hypothetical protein
MLEKERVGECKRVDLDVDASTTGGGEEIFEKLREVIRKEAAARRRKEKCKGMDTKEKEDLKAGWKFKKKKKKKNLYPSKG